jgi:hypothetical protein
MFHVIGSFTTRRSGSQIRLFWNGSVRVEQDHIDESNNTHCGYQLRIKPSWAPDVPNSWVAAANDAGQAFSFVEQQSVPMNLSATFDDLPLNSYDVAIATRSSGQGLYTADGCEINPAAIPESIIVVESGR